MWSFFFLLLLQLLSEEMPAAVLSGLHLMLSHPSNITSVSPSDILGKSYFHLWFISLRSGTAWATCSRVFEEAFLALLPRAKGQKSAHSHTISSLYQFFVFLVYTLETLSHEVFFYWLYVSGQKSFNPFSSHPLLFSTPWKTFKQCLL